MSRQFPLVRHVAAWLRRQGVGSAKVVVAVSGGPDSVALLEVLRAVGSRPLCVAHLNHKLRGPDADADAAFVQSLVESRPGEEYREGDADVAAQARSEGLNLEGTARRIRYAWLAGVAREVGAAWVATGHTADDQAETVLHRLLRGAGLQGLRGVAARRTLAPGVTLLRPLLERTRAEVTTYLQCLGRPARIDTSNFDRRYTRNRIRHELLPLLTREYNPAVNRVLARLAAQADEAYREEAERAAALLVAAEHPSAGEVRVLARAPLIAAPRRLVRAAFRLLWEREGWPTAGMSYDAWERVAAVAFGETAGVDLPSGLRVRGRTNVIQVSRAV